MIYNSNNSVTITFDHSYLYLLNQSATHQCLPSHLLVANR